MSEIDRERLFGQWQMLANRTQGLAAIIQNDVQTNSGQLQEWLDMCGDVEREFARLRRETFRGLTFGGAK